MKSMIFCIILASLSVQPHSAAGGSENPAVGQTQGSIPRITRVDPPKVVRGTAVALTVTGLDDAVKDVFVWVTELETVRQGEAQGVGTSVPRNQAIPASVALALC